MKSNSKWLLLILLITVAFFWKILFTNQFSVLTSEESTNQGYSWYQFSAASFQQGIIPIWDPFVNAGRTFVGGMETALFYPPKFILYFWPMGSSGKLSPRLFQHFFVFAHFLAAGFMFLLVREVGLRAFSALVAGITFGLGGLIARAPWPDMRDTAVWLPLIILFTLRAMRAKKSSLRIFYGSLAGVALGMAILAGRIHIVIMDGIVVVCAILYFTYQAQKVNTTAAGRRSLWIQGASILAIVGVIAFCVGAIQLLPSFEFSNRAIRYIAAPAPVDASGRILYADLKEELWPRAIFTSLFFTAFPGGSYGGEGFGLYLGIMPLILLIIGVWRNWNIPLVRFLAILSVAAFTFTLGSYSLVHGLAYILVPYLWIARGASRFIYIAHFGMAMLAAFGTETLFYGSETENRLGRFARALKWMLIVISIPLLVSSMVGKPEVNEWIFFSFLIMVGSCGLFHYILNGHRTLSTQFVLVFLIVFDLSGFCWVIQNRALAQRSSNDNLSNLMLCADLANFFKSRPGLFRVHMEDSYVPNIGEFYGVQIIQNKMATELKDFSSFRTSAPRAADLLNVRYFVRAKPIEGRKTAYSDPYWNVYENPNCLPRAWIVHKSVTVPKPELAIPRMREADFDPLQIAVLESALPPALEPKLEGVQEEASIELFQHNRLELRVRAQSRGLLVLSEIYYPGWKATVNGQPARILKVNGLLRGIVVPTGESKVSVRYAPTSIILGAILTFFGFSMPIIILFLVLRRGE
jgi:hypothetical protein